ncbi:MAG TPA: HIT family protein, partial [Gammaproteobacteria bacterium]|nr:HIT family protein [Gammaproteobacteria bacterium]
ERCPFDSPRETPNDYWEPIADLDVSTLCLTTNQAYRGHCILIYAPRHVTRPDQLDAGEWAAFTNDLHIAARTLVEVCRPDHINVACEGNVIPHMHWHIVPRYKTDPRWGAPHTMTHMEEMAYVPLASVERSRLIADICAGLEVLRSGRVP